MATGEKSISAALPFLIWTGFLGSHAFLFFLGGRLADNYQYKPEMNPFIPVGAAFGFFLALSGLWLLWRAKKQEKLSNYMRFFVLATALFEAVAILGVIGFVVGFSNVFFYSAALSAFFLHLLAFPYKYSPFYKA